MTTTAPAAPAAPAAEDSQAGPAAPRMHRPRQQPARKRPAVPGEEGTKPKHTHTRHTRGHREHPAHHHRNQPRHPRVPAHEEHKSASSATTTTTTSTTSAVDPSTAEDDDREACLTCCEPIEIHSLGQCNHNNICHLCCLRRRELYKDDQCWCKTKLPQVVFTHDATKTFSDFALDQLATTPKLQGIYFEAEDDRTAALKLWEYSCTVCHSTGFRSLGQLKRHLQEEHRLFFCAVCLEHRAAFTHEQPLFTKNELQRHLQGDKNADDAHQRCEFCNRSFYNKEHLYKHLTEKHESCHICRQQGIYFQYYRDYDDLERHFEKEHFLCTEKECLEKKFVVFRSALDLHAHDVAVHLAHRNMSKEKKREAAKLSLDLVFTDSPSRGVQQRADTAGPAPRRGGRGGGRRGGGRDHYSSGSDEDAPLDESLPTAPRTPNLEEVQSWPTLPGADNAHPTSGGAPRRYAALTRDDWSASRGGGRAPSGVPQGEDRWPTLPGGGAGGGGAKNKKQPARGTSWARSVASGASSSSSSSSSSGPAPVGFSEDPFSWLPPPPSADHYGGNYHHNTTVRPLLGVWGGGNQPAAPAQGGGKKKGKQVLFRVG